nr:MAG TPA: hypothetical protein [Caudoviricetes sp.]
MKRFHACSFGDGSLQFASLKAPVSGRSGMNASRIS